ncbi:MAG: hypothetical protein IJ639_01655 [Ruminococcus sp.]|nr:hypothetical protein [Ruminococcus sp.]
MKTNRHSLMAKGIMVLLSLLIIVFIITYSWFTIAQPDSEAHGISVKTKSGSDFEYAIGFKTSQTFGEYLVTDFTNREEQELDIEHLNVDGKYQEDGTTLINYNLMYDYTPIDVTGDGYTLIRPAMDYGNWKINTGTNDYSIAEANTQYISFDLILRSKSATTLSLGPNSYAIGASEVVSGVAQPDGSLLTGNSVTRPSDYGSFSRDAIVGAVRVAFLGYDDPDDELTADSFTSGLQDDMLSHTPSLLWVPRPDLYLNNNGSDLSTSGWSLNTGVALGQTFNLNSQALNDSTYSTYRHQQYDIFNNFNLNVVTNDNSYVHVSSKDAEGSGYHLNDTVSLIQLKYPKTIREKDEDVTYYYGKVRVRIWVEGTDSESRRALSKGKFKLNFDLTTN